MNWVTSVAAAASLLTLLCSFSLLGTVRKRERRGGGGGERGSGEGEREGGMGMGGLAASANAEAQHFQSRCGSK